MSISRIYSNPGGSHRLRRSGWSADPEARRRKKKYKELKKLARQRRIEAEERAKAKALAGAPPPTPIAVVLAVPTPAERVRPEGVTYACRDGQTEFRSLILAAYGRCVVTGCDVEPVLQAAHIIPYVDARSNIVSNGLCLRSDIHALYDRNLIRIGADGVVRVDANVTCQDYRRLDGRAIAAPAREGDKPDGALMSVRHEYV